MKIKVKILGIHRECELLRAYRSKSTGELGYVDVRVIGGRVPQGHSDYWYKVSVAMVRKSDREAIASTLPPKKERVNAS